MVDLPLPAHRQPCDSLQQRGERVGVRGSKGLCALGYPPLTAALSRRGRRPLLPLTLALSPQAGRGDSRWRAP
jgi:hypothetical protein